MIFMIIFTMKNIRLLGSSVDTILVAMTSYWWSPLLMKSRGMGSLHMGAESNILDCNKSIGNGCEGV